MPEILLVNPRKRRKTQRKKTVAKKRRSAAQKAATRKMIAANRRKNPRRRKTVARKRRRKPATRKRAASRRRAPQRRRNPGTRRRARSRNPAPRLTMRSVQNQLVDAGTGAVGALGLDIIQGYLPIPANLKTGLIGTGVKALLAIGMGMVAANFKVIRGATANKMVNGALTVVLHDEFKKQVANFAPGIQMGEYLADDGLGYYGSGYPAGIMGGDEYGGMGSYLPELDTDDLSMDETNLGMYESGDPVYMEDMSYG